MGPKFRSVPSESIGTGPLGSELSLLGNDFCIMMGYLAGSEIGPVEVGNDFHVSSEVAYKSCGITLRKGKKSH